MGIDDKKNPILLATAGSMSNYLERTMGRKYLRSDGAGLVMICISILLFSLAGILEQLEEESPAAFGGVLPALENFLAMLGAALITTGMDFVVRPSSKQCPDCKIRIKRAADQCPYCHNEF
jgi:hypothetical protein